MVSIGAFLSPLLLAAALSAGTQVDLSGPWQFHTGDDLAWAQPDFDDSGWESVSIPTGWGRSSPTATWSWYRRRVRVDLPAVEKSTEIGFLVGKIDSAYEFYAGGILLGHVGGLPPDASMDYDRDRLHVVPTSTINRDGTLVLAFRVWKSPETESSVGGPVEGEFLLGPALDLQRQELLHEVGQLFLGLLFILVGIHHLYLFSRRATLKEYFWYALVAIDAGLYSLLRTQWKYAFAVPFSLFKELEYFVLLILPALLVQFVWPLVGATIPRWLRAYQWACIALALVVSLTPGVRLNLYALPWWQISLIPVVVAALLLLLKTSFRGQPEARTIISGMVIFVAFALHDIAVDRGLLHTPRVMAYGFGALVVFMGLCLANRFSRIQTELGALTEDLEKRVMARTKELERQTAEAAQANQAKSQFLATMSHEIRTPLNAVIGMTELVLSSPLGADQRESIEIVRRSGESLLLLVNDILDFSKIESGKLEFESQAFSLRSCIEDAFDLVSPIAGAKGLELAYVVEGDVAPMVWGDAKRVRQVLLNLIGNAVKFTQSGGVMVTVREDMAPGDLSRLHVTIADTGIGIPMELRHRLFQSFSQVDSSHAREYGGTGLGLVISRRLCELMGGEMWLGDQAGPGSVFAFTLPAQGAPGETPVWLAREQQELAGRTALVFGGGPFLSQMLDKCLDGWGVVGLRTDSPEEAFNITGNGNTDVALIVLDDGGKGLAFIERLRESPSASALPQIAIGPSSIPHELGRGAPQSPVVRVRTPLVPARLHRALLDALGFGVASTSPDHPLAVPDAIRKSLRILLAEDNVVNQKVAMSMLDRLGYRADLAANGHEVIHGLEKRQYDVILLDVQMPEMDGLEAARRIRESGDTGPWLIALTANTLEGDREACMAAGMNDYLSKPVKLADLAAALRRSPPWLPAFPETPSIG